MEANSEAVASSSSECWAAVKYGEWVNDVGGPQKYQYKTLKVVRSKHKKVSEKNSDLITIMKKRGAMIYSAEQ